ncbi:hypothetical protein Zmor_006597 [Zophobas morio]|uniref:Regulatory protein zeste n=1 Tax=Zophobas morio TaxID=2755281 RepID=A0AA38MMU8_9CUCU|nr:hypothetical protein Zmor_006597 [Zophobas morio]
MSSSSSKAPKRSKNFTGHEKSELTQIIQRYAHIIENKKTDAVSVKQKLNCWEEIKTEFNAVTTEGPRDVQSLKTFYQNTKRSLKKERAEKNKETYISILENKLDNRGEGTPQDTGEPEMEITEALQVLETIEKKKTKKTGGGSYSPILPTGADAILGELLADQLQPLENSFDDGAQYFGLYTGTNGHASF